MPTYDLATRFIPVDQRIWALHAGKAKRHYRSFQAESKVFLELPGFGANADTFNNISAIRRHIRMSDAIRRAVAGAAVQPSRNPNTYSGEPSNEASFNAVVGWAKALYTDAKPGDLILIPGYGSYSEVLIGEITEEFDPDHALAVRPFENEPTPYRPVKWVATHIEKRNFSHSVAKSIGNRHAIIEIADAAQKAEIRKKVYNNYSIGDMSKASFYGPLYNSKDPAAVFLSVEMISYFLAAYNATQRGDGHLLADMSIAQVISTYHSDDIVKDFTFRFESPGNILVAVATPVLAMFVGLAVTLAADGHSFADIINNLALVNSADPGNAQQLDNASDVLQGVMNSIGEDRYNELKDKAEIAKNKIGLKTTMRQVAP